VSTFSREVRGLLDSPVDDAGPSTAIRPGVEDAGSSTAHPASQFWQAALAAVRQHARALAGAPLPDLTPDTPIADLGLDSLQRLDLVASMS
jgi:hypothetical protein